MTQPSQRQVGMAPINGTQIAYEVTGSGHPLVLVHAGVANQHMWDDQVAVFAEHYRVIRYDTRAFGQSPLGAVPFSFHNDLHALLRFLQVERAYLVGCSMGGSTCIDFALEHPEMAAALVTVCSSPSGYEMEGEPPNQSQWAALSEAVEAQDWERMTDLYVQRWMDGPYRTADDVDATVRERLRTMASTAARSEEEEQAQPLEPPAAHRLHELKLPTLVIAGDLDYAQLLDAASFMSERIAGARQAIIHTAHIPSMERPAEFNQLVLDFLANMVSN